MNTKTEDSEWSKIELIKAKLAECVEEARRQGWGELTDQIAEYEHTAHDLEYVVKELGYKPTREQWAQAGLKWVGDAHVTDDETSAEDCV